MGRRKRADNIKTTGNAGGSKGSKEEVKALQAQLKAKSAEGQIPSTPFLALFRRFLWRPRRITVRLTVG
jgi:hypothetical protein